MEHEPAEIGTSRRRGTDLRAWVVTNRTEDRSEVVYARSRNEARAAGARMLDDSYVDVAVRRAPEWDNQKPTIQNRLAAGWWFECPGCFGQLYAEDAPLIVNGSAFCDAACHDRHEHHAAQLAGLNRGREFRINEALYDEHAGRPGWHREGFTVGLERYATEAA